MTPAFVEPTPRLLLSGLRSAVQTFQSLRNVTPINMVVLFLLIAERGTGVGAAELVRLAGVSHASVSRNVQALGRGREGEPGLGLVKKTIDTRNPRAHSIQLTKTGWALVARMTDELAGPIKAASSVGIFLGTDGQRGAPAASQLVHEPSAWARWEMWAD